MSSILFTDAGPEPSHTVGQMLAAIKMNATKIRTIMATLGLQGFNYSVSIGPNDFPLQELYTSPTTGETISCTNTFATSGGGNTILQAVYMYAATPPALTTGDIVDYMNISYNSDDIVTGTSWGTLIA